MSGGTPVQLNSARYPTVHRDRCLLQLTSDIKSDPENMSPLMLCAEHEEEPAVEGQSEGLRATPAVLRVPARPAPAPAPRGTPHRKEGIRAELGGKELRLWAHTHESMEGQTDPAGHSALASRSAAAQACLSSFHTGQGSAHNIRPLTTP